MAGWPDGPPWNVEVNPAGASGADNMAADERLLAAAARTGGCFLRLYRWDPPTLSFGRNEPIAELYDLALIARRGIATVRRPTGGKAVWHEHELTYAVAAPIAVFGSLRAAYGAIHRTLAAALRALGADTTLAASGGPAVRPAGHPTSCFAAAVGGEILAGGRKLVGSAQVRRGPALLQHGSILLAGSQDVVAEVSRVAATGGGTTLAAVLGRPVPFAEVAGAVVSAWPSGVARGAVEC
jgi:lipoate-protein ligase A